MVDILSLTANLADLDISFSDKLCLKNVITNGCRACLAACPRQALSVNEKSQVVLDSKKCNSCGLCLSACPMECFSTKPDFTDTLLLKLKQGLPQILSCSKSGQEDSIQFNCLAALSEGLLFTSALKTGRVFLITDSCANCDIAEKALPIIKRKVEQANDLLKLLNSNSAIDVSEQPLKLEKSVDRSQFLKTAASEFLKVGLASLPKTEEKDLLPKKRRLLLQPFKGKTIRKQINNKLPFFTLSLEGNLCDLCLKCVQFCPTESLAADFKEKKPRATIEFKMSHCLGCNLCSRLCPKNCLAVKRAKRIQGLFKSKTLASYKTIHCKQCGKVIVDKEEKLCASCRKTLNLNERLASIFD